MQETARVHDDANPVIVSYLDSDQILLRLRDQTNPNQILDELHRFFDNVLQQETPRIIFDMGNVPFPSGSFIALLISKTTEARRLGGDVEIINLLDTAINHFSIFTPLTYLSILSDASQILAQPLLEEPHPDMEVVHHIENDIDSTLKIQANVDALQKATQYITEYAKTAGIAPIERSKLKIAVYEACMNIIEHGYHYETEKDIVISVETDLTRFKITITDWGKPFTGFGQNEYNVHTAFNEQHRGGFGLYIIDQSVDEMQYEVTAEGNHLRLIKNIPIFK